MPPQTHYAKSGEVNIAYQVVGHGPLDLVFVPGFVSHLDLQWADPRVARFLEKLASFSRLIMFDKRGTGLSDPVAPAPVEDRMESRTTVLASRSGRTRALTRPDLDASALPWRSEHWCLSLLGAASVPVRQRHYDRRLTAGPAAFRASSIPSRTSCIPNRNSSSIGTLVSSSAAATLAG
jgi:hypothetical protein